MPAQDVLHPGHIVIVVQGALPGPRGLGGQFLAPRALPGRRVAGATGCPARAARSGWSSTAPRALRARFRRRPPAETTNSTAASAATPTPDHTFIENTKEVAKVPIAVPIFQNISMEPVR